MAIICPKCGREFLGQREKCPVCGCATIEDGVSVLGQTGNQREYQFQTERRSPTQMQYPVKRGNNLVSCPECGRQISKKAAICPGCGYAFEKTKFCKFCAASIPEDSVVCTKCGRQVENIREADKGIVINNNNNNNASAAVSAVAANNGVQGLISPKSRLVTLLLCFFLGWFAIHRFYVGKIGTAILMIILMFTGIGELWLVIDFFIILFGGFTDGFGRRIITW